MGDESDGIEEAFEGQLRVLVIAAGQVGERLARVREEALRNAQARSEQEYRELQSRIEAERRAARVEMANVHRSEWWDRATPEQIGRTYQLARAWSQEDPEAVRTEQRVRDELRARYGVDTAGSDAERGHAATEQAEDGRNLYDSAERREGTARDLEAKGIDREVVATRMRADVSQAKPATEAVKAGAAARAPKARKTRGRAAQVQRTGLDR